MAQIQQISLDRIRPNPWNPNQMNETQAQALRESITEFGNDLQPVLVRPIDGGRFQIVDGEHRYKLALEMGESSIDCIVKDLSETDVKRLTQILRSHGENDPAKLKELFDSLLVELSPDDVIKGLPMDTAGELDDLLGELEGMIDDEYGLDGDGFEGLTDEEPVLKECPNCGHKWS
jgi:ParB-like chromosome segregation protein Spo0J